jgi:PAS domain S-box-containing protein
LEDPSHGAPIRRDHGAQELHIGGRPYILVPKSDFERLLIEAELPRTDAAAIAAESFGRDLRARRHASHLTLAAIAERAGIAQETLSRIENGHTNPTIGTVRSILRALGSNGQKTDSRLLAPAAVPRDSGEAEPADTALIRTVREELAESHQSGELKARLAAIVENSDDAIVSKTLQGIVTSWNAGAERLFGFSAGDMVGQSITRIIPPDRLPEETGILAKVVRGERLEHFETIRRRKDGSLVDVSITVSPLRDESGRIIGASKIARDITAQKRLHEEALQVNAMLEDRVRERTRSLQESVQELDSFAYTVAHDLRAPLRAVHSFGEILLEECAPKLTETERKYLVEMVRAGARMDTLISDLLAYSRISRQDIPLSTVDLGSLIDGILVDLAGELTDRKAQIQVDRPLPRVTGHALMLGQALLNLIANAVKFVLPGTTPRVRIRAEREPGGRIRIWVEDNGIGIAADHQTRLFRVFERLHGREEYPGTGIGLAIVRRALERMRGSSGVVSAPGEGSRFWIELPEAS